MKPGAQIAVGIVGILGAMAILGVVLVKMEVIGLPAQFYPPAMPGELSNPKLVAMFNERIDGLEKGELDASWYPGLIPQAAANAHLWLGEVREVVTHCRYGASHKYNYFLLDVTLASGQVLPNMSAGTNRCNDDYDTAMRVTFEVGRVVDVKTSGAEVTRPLEYAQGAVKVTVTALIDHDLRARPDRYYWPDAPQATPAEQWGKL